MPQLKLSTPLRDTGAAVHELTDPHITVGRISENSLQIEDASVSSGHATLTLDSSGDYVLRDIGSTNGTLLNGEALDPDTDYTLKNGDRVTFGHVEALYVSENPPATRPLPEPQEVTATVAASSARPVGFSNASPFPTKKKKRDTIGILLLIFAAVAIGMCGYVILLCYTMRAPTF